MPVENEGFFWEPLQKIYSTENTPGNKHETLKKMMISNFEFIAPMTSGFLAVRTLLGLHKATSSCTFNFKPNNVH